MTWISLKDLKRKFKLIGLALWNVKSFRFNFEIKLNPSKFGVECSRTDLAFWSISATRQILPTPANLRLVKSRPGSRCQRGGSAGIRVHRLHAFDAALRFYHNSIHYQYILLHLDRWCRLHFQVLHQRQRRSAGQEVSKAVAASVLVMCERRSRRGGAIGRRSCKAVAAHHARAQIPDQGGVLLWRNFEYPSAVRVVKALISFHEFSLHLRAEEETPDFQISSGSRQNKKFQKIKSLGNPNDNWSK